MTVKELIKELMQFPMDEIVYAYDREDQQEEVTEVKMGHCWCDETDKLMVT